VRGNAQEAGCLQIEIEKDWIPFIVKNLWESQLPNGFFFHLIIYFLNEIKIKTKILINVILYL